jgi:two-component system response regulator CpxR
MDNTLEKKSTFRMLKDLALGEKTEKTPLRVLIIDDDEKFRRLLGQYLHTNGFAVTEAGDGRGGIRHVSESKFDALILDLMLPGFDGMEVMRRLGPDRRLPVLMLTARGDEPDRIVGLEMGADDYLAKTCSPREILAHLRALTRRYQRMEQRQTLESVQVGDLRVDESSRTATLRGEALSLTSLEFDLLFTLARCAGSIRTRDQLLQEVAERPQGRFDRSIDVHISSLRHKLGDNPRSPEFIVTVRNTGYMIRRPL